MTEPNDYLQQPNLSLEQILELIRNQKKSFEEFIDTPYRHNLMWAKHTMRVRQGHTFSLDDAGIIPADPIAPDYIPGTPIQLQPDGSVNSLWVRDSFPTPFAPATRRTGDPDTLPRLAIASSQDKFYVMVGSNSINDIDVSPGTDGGRGALSAERVLAFNQDGTRYVDSEGNPSLDITEKGVGGGTTFTYPSAPFHPVGQPIGYSATRSEYRAVFTQRYGSGIAIHGNTIYMGFRLFQVEATETATLTSINPRRFTNVNSAVLEYVYAGIMKIENNTFRGYEATGNAGGMVVVGDLLYYVSGNKVKSLKLKSNAFARTNFNTNTNRVRPPDIRADSIGPEFDIFELNDTPSALSYIHDRFLIADGTNQIHVHSLDGTAMPAEKIELSYSDNPIIQGMTVADGVLYVLDATGTVYPVEV
ncbi:MAG: hypothetical protein OXC46_00800 [Thaumarchaeota archaeon]|nr:hypothetical protein [Nitrososphaerota archaeon]